MKKNNTPTKCKPNPDKIPTRSPTPWDLVLPVLLPPLSLKFPQELDFYSELRGYQLQGISWLLDNPSALLADEMGTGKTVQAVNALRLLFRQRKIRSALVVCPPAVIGGVNLSIETGHSEGWRGHFYHWASELEVAVMRGGNKDQRKLAWERPFHVYITTYDTLRGDIQKQVLSNYSKFDCIVLDEAHKIKNRITKTSKAIRNLKSKYRWALTGTPIQNSLEDIKSLFAFIQPNIFEDNIEYSLEVTKQVIDPYMLRRLKQDVLNDLPEKVHQEDWLKLNRDQKADYNRVLNAGKKQIQTSLGIEATNQVQSHILKLITELKKICNFATGKEESPKTELLLEYIETIAASNQKVLVFSQYKLEGTDKIAKVLEKEGFGYVLYTGDTSERRKKQAINDFRSNPDITVFLATIKSAGEGLTLIEATYVIHFDHWWNPATMKQAEDRTHRIGQKSSVTVYSFWMEGTIEKRIRDKLKEKHSLVENTVDELAVEAIENWLSTEELLDILDIQPTVRTIEVEATPVDTPQPELKTQKNQQPTTTTSVKSPESTSGHSVEATTGSQQMSNDHHNTVESYVSTSSQSTNVESSQMPNERLRQVEKNLKRLREQLACKEDTLTTIAPEERVRIKQQISDLKLEIKPYEEEYWKLIAIRSTEIEVSEPEAEIVVAEIIESVGQLKTSSQYPPEILQVLEKFMLKLVSQIHLPLQS
jgi:SNF2 family DNA or RNA helicase